MQSIILLFLCLIIGIALQRISAFPKNTHTVLNQYVLWVALPAMALYYLPKVELGFDLLFPASVAWISFGLAYVFFNFLGKQFGWSRKLIGCLILTGGLGNTSFVGIPVIEALFGKEGLKTLIIVDLPGTFIVLSTLGILVAATYSKGTQSTSFFKKVIIFPPFIAFIIGLLMTVIKVDFPFELSETFKTLAGTVSPIALISVGFQLKFHRESKHYRYLFGFRIIFSASDSSCCYFRIIFRSFRQRRFSYTSLYYRSSNGSDDHGSNSGRFVRA